MPLAAPVTVYGPTGESLASIARTADNPQGPGIPPRGGSRGEQFVYPLWPGMQALAMEGSYYVAATATPGTGITLSVATGTTFSDTQALVCINNNDSAISAGGTGKSIYLDFIKIIVTTAPTSASSWSCAHRLDPAQTRGVAGTKLGATGTDPKPSNGGVGVASNAGIFALGASAVTVAASSNIRNMGRNTLRGQIPVVLDDITIKFASGEMAAGGVSISQSTVGGITVFGPPIVIPPGGSYVLNEWAAARTALLAGELIVGYAER